MNNLNMLFSVVFLSTLSLRRATYFSGVMRQNPGISIHALLAESDSRAVQICCAVSEFLSTLSLRRATPVVPAELTTLINISIHALLAESDLQYPHFWPVLLDYFYPRSPCGERRGFHKINCQMMVISIHALLAESDIVNL